MKKTGNFIYIVILYLNSACTVAQPKIFLQPFAEGFDHPVTIANAGDIRLFVAEQPGTIRIVDSGGFVSNIPFLDIRDRVNSGGTEQGLLGLAFHPGYKNNGYFFVHYVGTGDSIHISRFSVSKSHPGQADPGSEVKIMTLFHPYTNHNGGNLAFGPDGYLYIGLGDGGSAGDPGNRAQDSLQYPGKLLRIDIDHGSNYRSPPSNPFFGHKGALNEIWAMGLRNPWRFSFDRKTGDLWIADVGQDLYEEIDFQPNNSKGGENYGWRCYEGNSSYNTTGCKPAPVYTFPVYVYSHSPGNNCSVTGGFVYRGKNYHGLNGHYFFADYCTDRIWTIHDSSGKWIVKYMGQFSGNNFSTYGEDYQGELYIAGLSTGNIYRVADSASLNLKKSVPGLNWKITPNPFRKEILVQFLSTEAEYGIYVLNQEGSEMMRIITVDKSRLLDLGFLPSGMYILKVISECSVGIKKILKL